MGAVEKRKNMCLTIPKKVIFTSTDKRIFIVENHKGDRQEVKSIVRLKIGDYCLTQQNVAIQKIGKKEAEELMNEIFNNLQGREGL